MRKEHSDMASLKQRRLRIGAIVLVVLIAGAAAYAMRGRLAETPFVGRFLSTPAATTASDDPDAITRAPAGSTTRDPAMPAAGTRDAGTARAEITIDPRRQQ